MRNDPASEAAGVEARLDPTAPPDYRALAAQLAVAWRKRRPRRVGLGGGQGAGKTSLGRLIEAACAEVGLRAAVVGLDDYYLPRTQRLAFAARTHPLFETRGLPGSHDVGALRAAMDALLEPGPVELPRFDKGRDDRGGTEVREGPFDLVVLEGWCVGAGPAPKGESGAPLNALEREEDAGGEWRAEIESRLDGDYADLWSILDELVFLRVPGLDAVRRWRLQQESSLPAERRLDAAAVDRFVQHYERLTIRMLADLPRRAEWTVVLADDHSVARIDQGTRDGP